MNGEEKKARAASLGLTVEQLEEGIKNGTITAEPSTPPPSYEEEKEKVLKGASGSRGKLAKGAIAVGEGVADVQNRASNESAEAINRQIKDLAQNSDRYEAKAEEITKKKIEANNTYREVVEKANKAQVESNNTILQRYINDAEAARKENELLGKAERRATRWTGLAELGAALSNLISVTQGASNQQVKFYSEDWMKRSEQNRKDRIRRLDSLNDRRSAIEQQMAALQSSTAKELANVDLNNAMYQNAREEDSAKRQYDLGVTIGGLNREAETTKIGGKATADMTRWQGLGNAVTAKNTPRYGGGTGGRGGKMRKSGYYPLMIDGEQYWMDDKTLFRNIQALKRSINVLNVEDQKELDNIANKSQDDQAKFLLSAMESNPGLKDALKKLSPGKVDDGETVEKKDAAEAYE